MRLLLERGGRLRSRNVMTPPALEDLSPPIAEAISKADDVAAAVEAAQISKAAADEAVLAARKDRRAGIAAATLNSNGKTPKDPVPAALLQAEEARQKLDGVELAAEIQAATVLDVVEANRAQFVAAATASRDQAAAEYEAAIDPIRQRRQALVEAEATLAWAMSFPHGKRADWSPIQTTAAVIAIGERMVSWAAVEAGLRRDADPVERRLDPGRPLTLPEELERIRRDGPPVGPNGSPSPSMRPGGLVVDGALLVMPGEPA